jgi:hypothetical protein
VAAVGLVLFAAGLTDALRRHDWDVSGFVLLGAKQPWAAHPAFAAVTRPDDGVGYDGQAYFAIAQNPLANHRDHIDFPFRHTRILYPLACFLLSGGHPPLLLWVMPAVNLAVIGGLTLGGARYAVRHRLSAWWGLTLPLALNVLLPVVRDLTDVTAYLTAFALLAAWERRAHPLWLLAVAAAAALSREQNLAVAGVVAAAAAWRREWRIAGAVAVGTLALPAWMLYLRGVYGEWTVMPTGGVLEPPPVGLRHWVDWQSHNLGMRVTRWAFAGFTLGQVGLIARQLVLDRRPAAVTLVGLAGVALAAVSGPDIYHDYWGYGRTLFWIPLGGWMCGVRSRWKPALWFNLLALVLVRGTLGVM